MMNIDILKYFMDIRIYYLNGNIYLNILFKYKFKYTI